MGFRERDGLRPDRGDTLIEILIALVVISLSVVGLMGGLLNSASSSTTHRNLATLDSVLRSTGTSVQAAVSGAPGSAPDSQPLFTRCASSYAVSGPLYPSTQAAGSWVSVPVIGLAANKSLTATVGTAAPVTAGTTSSSGAAIATFTIPASVTAGTYSVSLTDGTTTVTAPSISVLASTSATNSDILATPTGASIFTMASSIKDWDGSGFNLTPAQCVATSTNADFQEMTLTLVDTTQVNGATDSTSLVLSNTNTLTYPSETIASSPSATASLGQTLSFTATLTGSGTSTPSGTVSWTFASPVPSGTACRGGNTTAVVQAPTSSTSTCTVQNPQAGDYTLTGVYSGDTTFTSQSSDVTSSGSLDTVTVNQGTAIVTTSGTASPAQIGSTIQFTATVSGVAGITPTGTVTWSFPAGTPAGATCSNLTSPNNVGTLNGSGESTCTVSPALPGTYEPSATYSGDTNYISNPAATGNQWAVTVSTVASSTTTVSSTVTTATPGSNLTFTATIAGVVGLTPTGSVKWSFPAGAPAGATCSNLMSNSGTLSASGQSSCIVTNAAAGTYTPTAAYQGSIYYSASSNNNWTITVSKEVPTVNVSGVVKSTTLTFTAVVTPTQTTDPTPTGSVTFAVTDGNGNNYLCTPATSSVNSDGPKVNTASTSCRISSASASITYEAQAIYTPDNQSNGTYASATGTGSQVG